uniref:Uncharacterized protein n=1 Tax=Physcomitrium patens TaxID=3218 RepID=A0A2K1JTN3_PHYPA|nr:hypothetical protein PHYPA_014658 [Physcomitrium patens]
MQTSAANTKDRILNNSFGIMCFRSFYRSSILKCDNHNNVRDEAALETKM